MSVLIHSVCFILNTGGMLNSPNLGGLQLETQDNKIKEREESEREAAEKFHTDGTILSGKPNNV